MEVCDADAHEAPLKRERVANSAGATPRVASALAAIADTASFVSSDAIDERYDLGPGRGRAAIDRSWADVAAKVSHR